MKFEPITEEQARSFYETLYTDQMPAGKQWVFVQGLHNMPEDRTAFLMMADDGLFGIVEVKPTLEKVSQF